MNFVLIKHANQRIQKDILGRLCNQYPDGWGVMFSDGTELLYHQETQSAANKVYKVLNEAVADLSCVVCFHRKEGTKVEVFPKPCYIDEKDKGKKIAYVQIGMSRRLAKMGTPNGDFFIPMFKDLAKARDPKDMLTTRWVDHALHAVVENRAMLIFMDFTGKVTQYGKSAFPGKDYPWGWASENISVLSSSLVSGEEAKDNAVIKPDGKVINVEEAKKKLQPPAPPIEKVEPIAGKKVYPRIAPQGEPDLFLDKKPKKVFNKQTGMWNVDKNWKVDAIQTLLGEKAMTGEGAWLYPTASELTPETIARIKMKFFDEAGNEIPNPDLLEELTKPRPTFIQEAGLSSLDDVSRMTPHAIRDLITNEPKAAELLFYNLLTERLNKKEVAKVEPKKAATG